MPETLSNVSRILLFGRVVEDVTIGPRTAPSLAPVGAPAPLAGRGINNFLAAQIGGAQPPQVQLPLAGPALAAAQQVRPNLARIYAFAYEGRYYELAKPALFVVHGDGDVITMPPNVETTGLEATTLTGFAPDVRVWAYDKSDMSIRLDPESGTFEQILLEAELSAERISVQYSGQGVRFAGQGARFAGQGARLRGNRGSGTDE